MEGGTGMGMVQLSLSQKPALLHIKFHLKSNFGYSKCPGLFVFQSIHQEQIHPGAPTGIIKSVLALNTANIAGEKFCLDRRCFSKASELIPDITTSFSHPSFAH